MALTSFQSDILRLLATNRRENAGSYVAGGLALNHCLGTPRLSRDIDIFHDSEAALFASWEMDRRTLETAGYSVRHLLSAACGKDPGFSPSSMLEYVARRHYNQVEIDDRIIPRGAYDAGELCRFWHEQVEYTREAVAVFPRDKAGMCVLDRDGKPYKGSPLHLPDAIASGEVVFHEGRICGAWPQIVG